MAARQDKPIAVCPKGLVGVVAKVLCPELVGDRGKCHRCSRVPAVGGLNPVHAQGSDGIDGQLADGSCWSTHGFLMILRSGTSIESELAARRIPLSPKACNLPEALHGQGNGGVKELLGYLPLAQTIPRTKVFRKTGSANVSLE